jgi:hypothetical protein
MKRVVCSRSRRQDGGFPAPEASSPHWQPGGEDLLHDDPRTWQDYIFCISLSILIKKRPPFEVKGGCSRGGVRVATAWGGCQRKSLRPRGGIGLAL